MASFSALLVLSLFSFFTTTSLFAAPKENWVPSNIKNEGLKQKIQNEKEKFNEDNLPLMQEFLKEYSSKGELEKLKKQVLELKGTAAPLLVKVMKESRFPDKNRWLATFLLGRILGKKSAPFISKFLEHPNWVLRLAALKTLGALSATDYGDLYAKKLSDESLVIRRQALVNIRELKLSQFAPEVWRMLYQRHNYLDTKGKMKRTPIIEDVIKTIGELGHSKATGHLLTMIQKKSYEDLFESLDYSLQKLTGKNSPNGDHFVKRVFWSKLATQEKQLF